MSEVKNGEIWKSPTHQTVVVLFDHSDHWIVTSLPYTTIDGRTALMTASINGRMNWSSSQDLYEWLKQWKWELTTLQLSLQIDDRRTNDGQEDSSNN